MRRLEAATCQSHTVASSTNMRRRHLNVRRRGLYTLASPTQDLRDLEVKLGELIAATRESTTSASTPRWAAQGLRHASVGFMLAGKTIYTGI
jgi:hypothetical protein